MLLPKQQRSTYSCFFPTDTIQAATADLSREDLQQQAVYDHGRIHSHEDGPGE